MADNNGFRSALSGFNKRDVLEYIDRITASWEEERREKELQLEDSEKRIEQQEQATAQAQQETQAALEQVQQLQAQLAEVHTAMARLQEQLTFANKKVEACTGKIKTLEDANESTSNQLDVYREQLEEATKRADSLQKTAEQLTGERDQAIAAAADARTTQEEETAARLQDLEQQLQQKEAYAASLQQENVRLQAQAQQVPFSQSDVDKLVCPLIEDCNRQTEETLNSLQDTLSSVLTQLGQMQHTVEQRRQAMHKDTAEAQNRLHTTFGADDTAQPHTAADPAAHFFR